MGILLAIFSSLTFSIVNFTGKYLINKKASPLIVATFYQLLTVIVYIPLLLNEKIVFPTDSSSIILFLINVSLYSIFTITGFFMFKYLDISYSSILGQTRTVITFIGAILIFNETVTLAKIIGVILIIFGNVYLFLNSMSKDSKKVSKLGLLLLLINTLAISLTSFFDAILISKFSVSFYGFIGFFVPGLVASIFLFRKLKLNEIKKELKLHFKGLMLMAIVAPIGYNSLLMAYGMASKSIIYPLGNLTTVFTVILGILLLKERDLLQKKIIAGVIVILGAILLTLSI